MKQLLIVLFCLISLVTKCQTTTFITDDVRAWVKIHFSKNAIPPFSFIYNGKNSDLFISNWAFREEKLSSAQGVEKYIFTYTDQKKSLLVSCEVLIFPDFNTVEWVLNFKNTGQVNTKIIEDAKPLNFSIQDKLPGEYLLHYATGSNASKTDFIPLEKRLQSDENFRMTTVGARGSSDKTGFPFFNLQNIGFGGVIVAIGWTGKWFAGVNKTQKNSVHLEAGMESMHLQLMPGEEIRTPKICLLFWKGNDRMIGHNKFRKFVLSHHTPKINGRIIETPLAAGLSRGGPSPCNEFTCLTESYARATIDRFVQFNIIPDVCWIDAGWYEGGNEWWEGVGNWTIDRKRFPNGFKPVSDAVHSIGSKLLVWFELERVRKGTRFYIEHPEWLLDYSATHNSKDLYNYETYLFDLGNTEARLWLTDFVTDFLKKEGIDYYRQDFNWVHARESWERKDTPDRKGISEIRYVEGLYAFWDSLRARIPGILIDNCASGGRRIDLESISRSVPLWRSDYGYGEPDGYQNHTFGLNYYLPLHGTGAFSSKPYDFRSSLGSSLVLFWDIHSAQSSVPQMQKSMSEFRKWRPYFYSDYYPLTSPKNIETDSIWLAYQLNRPVEGDGVIIAFRRKASLFQKQVVKLKGIVKEGTYQVTNEDTKAEIIKKGIDLVNGIELFIEKPLTSQIYSYRRLDTTISR